MYGEYMMDGHISCRYISVSVSTKILVMGIVRTVLDSCNIYEPILSRHLMHRVLKLALTKIWRMHAAAN